MDQNTSISKFMTRELITFKPDEDIWEVIKVIVNSKISGAPVVDSKGKLIGMLSEADCIKVILEIHDNRPGGNGVVADYMNREVRTVTADKTLMEVAYAFTHHSYKRFPVLEDGKLVGQISRSDILRAISKLSPNIQIVPNSWKPRVPVLEPSKRGRHTGNS
jgi:CBS domain-containing protein